ncbi:MAG TPA: DUF4142 domain-containing protein [Mucilaginibacter sp.]|nr:DUF4142 domain-containing protein [Mucilaginibacter sp.]
MKKLWTLVAATGMAGLILAGCGGAQKDAKEKADSANNSVDSLSKVQPNNKMAVSGPDADFAVEAANGGMGEVELGRLAEQKATNADVEAFGAMMVADHSKINGQMKKIAAAKNITLPDSVGSDVKKMETDLAAKSGADFDKAYVDEMVKDHKEDISAFEEAAKKVTYPELQDFISSNLPVLRKHLDAIQKIQTKMK